MLTIGLILPDVLGTYGDDGNALVLRQRARLRGIAAEIQPIYLGEPVPSGMDLYTVGGGEDTAQILAAEHLRTHRGLIDAARAGTPILAICAGLQVLGESFRASGRMVDGLGLIDATTSSLKVRMIGEIASTPVATSGSTEKPTASSKPVATSGSAISPASSSTPASTSGLAGEPTGPSAFPETDALRHARTFTRGLTEPLTGFANHMGATILGPDAAPLGALLRGTGNTDVHGVAHSAQPPVHAQAQTSYEGAVQGSVIATYMHGPALARNPQLADVLLARTMGIEVTDLPELGEQWTAPDAVETFPLSDAAKAQARQVTEEVTGLRRERLRELYPASAA